jgi:hypothetical protein
MSPVPEIVQLQTHASVMLALALLALPVLALAAPALMPHREVVAFHFQELIPPVMSKGVPSSEVHVKWNGRDG